VQTQKINATCNSLLWVGLQSMEGRGREDQKETIDKTYEGWKGLELAAEWGGFVGKKDAWKKRKASSSSKINECGIKLNQWDREWKDFVKSLAL